MIKSTQVDFFCLFFNEQKHFYIGNSNHRAKTEENQTQIFAEINDIQPKIKEVYKYCREIITRAEGIQNNLNNFNKDIQKDNSRTLT